MSSLHPFFSTPLTCGGFCSTMRPCCVACPGVLFCSGQGANGCCRLSADGCSGCHGHVGITVQGGLRKGTALLFCWCCNLCLKRACVVFGDGQHTQTQAHRDTETQKHRHTETQRHTDTGTQRHRDTETQRHRNTDTQTLAEYALLHCSHCVCHSRLRICKSSRTPQTETESR